MSSRESNSVGVARQVDKLCDRFESQWRGGKSPRIEDFLAAAPEEVRVALFEALLPVELELLAEKGASPTETDYGKRFPKHAKAIARCFRERAESVGAEETTVSRSSIRSAPPAPAEKALLPANIGRFRILSMLGQGAFGSVYRARDPQLQRDVAIKVPRPGSFATAQERERFLREARAAAAVQHPNICPVYEINNDADALYIVMAFVPGASLADYLQSRKNSLTPKQAAVIVRKLALALQAAHAKGIVHRDLKPANILFDRERQDVVVTDFGLARRSQADDIEITQAGAIMGTPAYMSPEQARGDSKNVGPAADIFSLGVILYELLVGVRPFTGSMGEILGKVQHVAPERPTKIKRGIDARLETICLKALAKTPAERFTSMREFADQLGEYLKQAPAGAVAEGAPGRKAPAPPVSDTAQMAEIIAAMSLERKAEARKIEQSHRGLTRMVLAVGGCLGSLMVLTACTGVVIGAWLYFRGGSSGPIVTVTLQNISYLQDHSVHYYLDGNEVDSKKLEGPLKLAVGDHKLEGKRGDETVEELRFRVGQDDNQKEIVTLPVERSGPPGQVHHIKPTSDLHVSSVAVSPDGRWIMAVQSSFSIHNFRSGSVVSLWDLNNGKKVHEEPLVDAELVAFASIGKHPYIAFRAAHAKPFVMQYDLSNPKRWKDLRRFESPRSYTAASLHLSRDGSFLLRGTSHDGAGTGISVWDTSDGKPVCVIDDLALGCLSPDGKRIFAAKGNDLIVHDIVDRKAVPAQTYKGHTSPITCVTCSADGRLVAAGTGEPANAVRVWEVESAKTFDHFARHGGSVSSVRFSPDGARLLSAGADGILRIAHVKTGNAIYETPAQGSAISSAVFSPGGGQAIFGLFDRTIKVWRLPN
ncbi:MAG TPA: serine/threonine-protein kinase [Gemmataceae bacterium]|nr:serine/threonine-protein kinase [Gemmataceae bacterium]